MTQQIINVIVIYLFASLMAVGLFYYLELGFWNEKNTSNAVQVGTKEVYNREQLDPNQYLEKRLEMMLEDVGYDSQYLGKIDSNSYSCWVFNRKMKGGEIILIPSNLLNGASDEKGKKALRLYVEEQTKHRIVDVVF